MYTAEEFETAFGAFQLTQKPFIFTYFKDINSETDPSLQEFKNKLNTLGHFYSPYSDFNDLWLQFNKELDRLLLDNFDKFLYSGPKEQQGSTKKIIQKAEKIYNIKKIDNAKFE